MIRADTYLSEMRCERRDAGKANRTGFAASLNRLRIHAIQKVFGSAHLPLSGRDNNIASAQFQGSFAAQASYGLLPVVIASISK